jgi:hypothetical protein
MSGGIEDTIFQNIETGSGENFADGDTYDPSGSEPAPKQTNRDQQDHELDNAEGQLRSRARAPKEDENLPPFIRKPLDQRRRDEGKQAADQQKATDEYGNPVGSNSFHVTRRLKSQLDNQRNIANGFKAQVEDLSRRVAEAEILNGLPRQLGMEAEELKDFVQIAALIKGNPVEGAKKALEIALARGANLKDIVNDEFIPNLNLNAVKTLIDSRLPERKPEPPVDTHDRDATLEAQQFMADYPEAKLHGPVIADQMKKIEADYEQRGVKVSKYLVAEKAFQRLEEFCQKNQLDINRDLAEQLQERQSPPSGARPNTPARQTPRPMPNGSNGGGDVVSRKKTVANSDDSFSSIVREAMAEEGYQF